MWGPEPCKRCGCACPGVASQLCAGRSHGMLPTVEGWRAPRKTADHCVRSWRSQDARRGPHSRHSQRCCPALVTSNPHMQQLISRALISIAQICMSWPPRARPLLVGACRHIMWQRLRCVCRHMQLGCLLCGTCLTPLVRQCEMYWVLVCVGLTIRHSTSSLRLLGAGWLPLGPSAAAWTCTTGFRRARR